MSSAGIAIPYRRGFDVARGGESPKDMPSIFEEIARRAVAAASGLEDRRKRIAIPAEDI